MWKREPVCVSLVQESSQGKTSSFKPYFSGSRAYGDRRERHLVYGEGLHRRHHGLVAKGVEGPQNDEGAADGGYDRQDGPGQLLKGSVAVSANKFQIQWYLSYFL